LAGVNLEWRKSFSPLAASPVISKNFYIIARFLERRGWEGEKHHPKQQDAG